AIGPGFDIGLALHFVSSLPRFGRFGNILTEPKSMKNKAKVIGLCPLVDRRPLFLSWSAPTMPPCGEKTLLV
ncbi:MAG TPA: hypothetical protein VFF03_19180, partial [Rhodocyclaceae bacterium]|nr:hypothetical protein [Rhodocyclaceae bacterium]